MSQIEEVATTHQAFAVLSALVSSAFPTYQIVIPLNVETLVKVVVVLSALASLAFQTYQIVNYGTDTLTNYAFLNDAS